MLIEILFLSFLLEFIINKIFIQLFILFMLFKERVFAMYFFSLPIFAHQKQRLEKYTQ